MSMEEQRARQEKVADDVVKTSAEEAGVTPMATGKLLYQVHSSTLS